MKRCKTCGIPLWLSWLMMGNWFGPRIQRFKNAKDCVDLLNKSVGERLKKEAILFAEEE